MLTPTQIQYQLAVNAPCEVRTVKRWLRSPQRVRPSIRERLERAARELGIELPLEQGVEPQPVPEPRP
jgi:hypothetical protein